MSSQRELDVSFVIVNFRAGSYVGECLRSLAKVRNEVGCEFIVVDNSPPDAATALEAEAGDHAWRVIESTANGGYGAACNRGLSEARGRYVCYLNADSRYNAGSIADLIRWLDRNPEVGLVGPTVLNLDGTRQYSCRSFPTWATVVSHRHSFLARFLPGNPLTSRYLRTDLNGNVEKVDWVSGCCMVARRQALEDVGGFDEGYFLFFEDVDLAYRLERARWKCVYYPNVSFYHVIGVSRASLSDRGSQAKYAGAARYFAKHLISNRLLSHVFHTAVRLWFGQPNASREASSAAKKLGITPSSAQ